ncbi:PucR family transcriptional regulator ligand-binding domain-containing protein [Corynebacterium callunae]|uniref:PucR family transcriptional regulator n=1 Tax=Corynebacterium callunae TaxID=1721 RepID=UPI0039825A14
MNLAPDHLDVDWLYRQKQLKLREIHPTRASFKEIQISELSDPSEFIQPNTVVLSVGIAFANHPQEFKNWAQKLAAAGVQAIGFGSGLTFPEVPQELVDAALECQLGLFEVPREIPFISITSAVQKEQSRRAGRRQQELLIEQEKLNSIAITGGLAALCQYTANTIGAAIAIVDSDGRIACSIPFAGLDAVPQAQAHLEGGSQAINNAEQVGILQRMTRFGDRHHMFSVLMNSRPSDQHRALIRHCAGLSDILLQRPHAMRTRETELKTLAMSLLLRHTDHAPNVREIFHDVTDASGQVRPVIISGTRAQAVNKALNHAAAQLEVHDRALAHLILHDTPEPAVLVFLRGSRTVKTTIELFGKYLREVRICIGLPTKIEKITPSLIQELVAQAVLLELGRFSEPRESSQMWLRNPAIQQALDARAQQTYDRLIDNDEVYGTELAATLVCFAQCGGQVGETATRLGIHRHTVRTRLERIAEICELDLSDPLTRAELLLIVATRGH